MCNIYVRVCLSAYVRRRERRLFACRGGGLGMNKEEGTRIRDGVGHGCGCLKVLDRGSTHVGEGPVCNQTTAMPGNSLLLSIPSELFLCV